MIRLTPGKMLAFACLTLSSNCIDFSDYIWRWTDLLDAQTYWMCRQLNIGFLLCELHTVPPWKLRIFSKSVAEPGTEPQSYSWVSLIPEQV